MNNLLSIEEQLSVTIISSVSIDQPPIEVLESFSDHDSHNKAAIHESQVDEPSNDIEAVTLVQ